MTTRDSDGQRIEILLGNLLRWGTLLSALVITLGGAAFLSQHGSESPHYLEFREQTADLRSVHGVVADALTGDTRGLIQLGMLLLVATPIARVVGALAAFAWQRDWAYVVVCSIVLSSLLYSLLAS